jgi:hypothetical protein
MRTTIVTLLILIAFAMTGVACDITRLNPKEPTSAVNLTYGAGGRCVGIGGMGADMYHKFPAATFIFGFESGLTGGSQGLVNVTNWEAKLTNDAGFAVNFGHCSTLAGQPSDLKEFKGFINITCQTRTDGHPSMFDQPLPSGYGMQWTYVDGEVDGSGYLYVMYQDSFTVDKGAYANCTRTGG